MADIKWKPGTRVTLVTDGSSLTNGSRSALSAEYDNATNKHLAAIFELTDVSFGTAPTAGSIIELYLLPSHDGTNYPDGSDTIIPASNLLVGFFVLKNQTAAQRLISRGINNEHVVLPPTKFRCLIWNQAGQTLSANWDLHILPFSQEVV